MQLTLQLGCQSEFHGWTLIHLLLCIFLKRDPKALTDQFRKTLSILSDPHHHNYTRWVLEQGISHSTLKDWDDLYMRLTVVICSNSSIVKNISYITLCEVIFPTWDNHSSSNLLVSYIYDSWNNIPNNTLSPYRCVGFETSYSICFSLYFHNPYDYYL